MCIVSGFLDRRKTNNEVTEPFYMRGPNPTEPVNFTHFHLNAYNIIILFKILGYIKNSGKYRL